MSHLERNLTPLRAIAPHTAAKVTAASTNDFTKTPGTDGTPTYSRTTTTNPKRLDWLGGTSMPKASAAPITATLDPFSAGANGLGLSIGTGYEWAAFAARLGRPQMLYIYEPEPALLRMAL